MILYGLPWKRTEIILSFLRLRPSTAFHTLLLTVRVKEKLQQDGRSGEITFRVKPQPTRDSWRAQKKPYAHQDPEIPQETEPDLPLSI